MRRVLWWEFATKWVRGYKWARFLAVALQAEVMALKKKGIHQESNPVNSITIKFINFFSHESDVKGYSCWRRKRGGRRKRWRWRWRYCRRRRRQRTKHHLKGVQQPYPFCVSLMRNCLLTLPYLSIGLLKNEKGKKKRGELAGDARIPY